MTIKDILHVTGASTKIIIMGVDKEHRKMKLLQNKVGNIDFSCIPYGYYDVEHMTVVEGEDNLVIRFDYPELSKNHLDILGELAVGYPYPTDWIDRLFIKYRDLDKVKEVLMKSKDEIYEEIKVLE